MTFRFALLAFGLAAALAGPRFFGNRCLDLAVSPVAARVTTGTVAIASSGGPAWTAMGSYSAAWGSAAPPLGQI